MTRGELTSELAASLGLRHEARFIVEEVMGTSVRNSQTVEPAELAAIRALAERKDPAQGKPRFGPIELHHTARNAIKPGISSRP